MTSFGPDIDTIAGLARRRRRAATVVAEEPTPAPTEEAPTEPPAGLGPAVPPPITPLPQPRLELLERDPTTLQPFEVFERMVAGGSSTADLVNFLRATPEAQRGAFAFKSIGVLNTQLEQLRSLTGEGQLVLARKLGFLGPEAAGFGAIPEPGVGPAFPIVGIEGALPTPTAPALTEAAFTRAVQAEAQARTIERSETSQAITELQQAGLVVAEVGPDGVARRIGDIESQLAGDIPLFDRQVLQQELDSLKAWESVKTIFSEENAKDVVADVERIGLRIADLNENLSGTLPPGQRELFQQELDGLTQDSDAFFATIVAFGRNEDTERVLTALGASRQDIDALFFVPGQFTTPESLGLPPAEAEPLTPWQRRRGESFLTPGFSPTAQRQAVLVQDIYDGLLGSPLIPEVEKDIIRQTGQVPLVYLKLSPAELAQLGVELAPAAADGLTLLQESQDTYGYWEDLLALEEPRLGITDQFAAGIGDVVGTLGGTLRWLGVEGLGEELSVEGAELGFYVPPAEWKGMFHPNFWTKQLPRALPFTLALVPAAIGGAYAGVAAAGAIGLGAFGTTVLSTLGAAAVSRPVESALEAGGAFDAALDQGMSKAEADRVARQVFGQNMALVGLDAAQFFVAFGPTPLRLGNRLVRYAVSGGKVLVVGLTEAGEEAVQDVITRQALGLRVTIDADMQQAMATGFAMGIGLGGVGDAYTGIQDISKKNLTPELNALLELSRLSFETAGFSSEVAEATALDAVAETLVGRRIVVDATKQTQTTEQVNQSSTFGVGNIEDTGMTVGEIGMVFEDLPVEVQASLETIKGVREAFPDFTVNNLARFIHNEVSGVEGMSSLTRFAQNSEIKKILGFWASERGSFSFSQEEALNKALSSQARPEELQAPLPEVSEVTTDQEVAELDADIAGRETALQDDPIAQRRVTVGRNLKRPLTFFISIREQSFPTSFTPKQAEQLLGRPLGAAAIDPRTRRVPRDVALDELSREFNMTPDEIAERVEEIAAERRTIRGLKADLAAIEVPAEPVAPAVEPVAEAPAALRETVPRGTVRHADYARGPEQARTELTREFYDAIPQSKLDIAATRYLRTGNINAYIEAMPEIDLLKLQALSEDVRANISEVVEIQSISREDLAKIEATLAQGGLSRETSGVLQAEVRKLREDITFMDQLITKLKGGNAINVEDAIQLGMALRTKKGGKLVPAVRKSGFYVDVQFARYAFYRDVSLPRGMFMDTIRLHQAIDGGRFEGGTQKFILWPTQRTDLAYRQFVDLAKSQIHQLAEKFKMTGFLNKPARQAAGNVLEHIDVARAELSAEALIESVPKIKALVAQFDAGTQRNIVDFARGARVFFEESLDQQNKARAKRQQDVIPHRRNYLQWVIETNLWSRLSGLEKRPGDVFHKALMVDYVKAEAPFNARALARQGGLAGYELERDLVRLMNDYAVTAGKDIFFTNIVHNAKIHTATLRSLGNPRSAALIEAWASEAYAGVLPQLSRAIRAIIPEKGLKPAFWLRRQLTKAVFPLNWTWNAFVQTSSIALTIMRYGPVNTIRGLDYFVPSVRHDVRANIYSAIVKGRRGGSIVFQDVGESVERSLRYEANPLEKLEHYVNFITTAFEDALTGVSVRAAHHYGTKLGYRGRALQEFASEGGAKTQSMYNFANIPGILRNKEVGTLFPFQTFALEVLNTVSEINIIGVRKVIGKAGAFETISATSPEGTATIRRRAKMLMQWMVSMVVINMVVDKAIDRKPWRLSSFIPFFSIMGAGMDTGNPWYYPMPVQYLAEFRNAVDSVLKFDQWTKLRTWFIRYHVPAGTQINRMLKGVEAVVHGEVTDVRGKQLFEVDPAEWLKAVSFGPYGTEQGREYIGGLNDRRGTWYEILGFDPPQRVSIGGEIQKAVDLLGTVEDGGNVNDFGDFVSVLRDIRRSVGEKRFLSADSPFIDGFLEAEEVRAEYDSITEGPMPPSERIAFDTEPGRTEDARTQWRVANPKKDAILAFYGFPGRIQTREAYGFVVKMAEDLGVSLDNLDAWLPPPDVVDDYFDYVDLTEGLSANSSEAKLFKLEHEAFHQWGQDAYGWRPDALKDENVDLLRLIVKYRVEDEAYDALETTVERDAFLEERPTYRDDRRRRDAMRLEIPDELLEEYVDYYNERSVAEAKIFRLEHEGLNEWGLGQGIWKDDLSDENLDALKLTVKWAPEEEAYDALETTEERVAFLDARPEYATARRRLEGMRLDFTPEEQDLFIQYSDLPTWGDWRQRFRRDHPEFNILLQKDETLDLAQFDPEKLSLENRDKIFGEHIDLFREYDDVEGLPDERAAQREAILSANPDFARARLVVLAYDMGLREEFVDTFPEWRAADTRPEDFEGTWYEDDWFLIENQPFYNAMLEDVGWQARDFSKVPTREVAALLEQYNTLGSKDRKGRENFRILNPLLDTYFVLARGYKPKRPLQPRDKVFALDAEASK